jgi:type IV fimbrial biogenesis protein FimT
MKNRSHGFTLMELMIVLALAATIFAIGAPSFNEFRRNNRLTGIANDFLGAIQVARGEAIKRQVPVAVCPSDNATDDVPTCTTGAFTGWIAFVDPDSNCIRAASEPILRVEARVDGDPAKPLYVKSNGVCISFAATGFRQLEGDTGKTVASRTVFCDTRGNAEQSPGIRQSAARGIEVTPTGRARITRVVSEIDTWSLACLP